MTFDPYNPSVFTMDAPCLPCCAPAPSACACALLIPGVPNKSDWNPSGDSPYASYSDATSSIASYVIDCIVFNYYTNLNGHTVPVSYDSYSSSFDGTTLSVSGSVTDTSPNAFGNVPAWSSISMKDGATISIPYTVSYSASDNDPVCEFHVAIYSCTDGSLVEQYDDVGAEGDTTLSGTFTSSALAEGEYILFFTGQGANGNFSNTTSLTATVTSSDVWWVNPVIALWDDSGTTRQLEACPKLYLPPLTESTGTWYASCADAAMAIANETVDCLVWDSGIGVPSSRSATGGSTLVYSVSDASPIFNFSGWASINAVSGETLSLTTSVDGCTLAIYDDSGAFVESIGPPAGTVTSSPLPYTGRYIIQFVKIFMGGSTASPQSVTLSSSGIMSTNPIAAYWDSGLTCPSILNCGDSCP